jgi:hypothetical protein
MTTERSLWLAGRSEPLTSVTSAVCFCGQDLDLCAGAHCPRCGARIAAPAA